jgi:hypothetical protein
MMMMMNVEQSVEWEWTGKTEVPGENLPQCHFVHHKSHMIWFGLEPGRRGKKPVTNHLSYGTTIRITLYISVRYCWFTCWAYLICYIIIKLYCPCCLDSSLSLFYAKKPWNLVLLLVNFGNSYQFLVLRGCLEFRTSSNYTESVPDIA